MCPVIVIYGLVARFTGKVYHLLPTKTRGMFGPIHIHVLSRIGLTLIWRFIHLSLTVK